MWKLRTTLSNPCQNSCRPSPTKSLLLVSATIQPSTTTKTLRSDIGRVLDVVIKIKTCNMLQESRSKNLVFSKSNRLDVVIFWVLLH